MGLSWYYVQREAQDAMKEKKKATPKLDLVQTKLPAEDLQRFKAHAALQGRRLSEVQEDALLDFFEDRDAHLKRGGITEKLYNPPPTEAKIANFLLDPKVSKKVDAIAEKDKSTGSRIVYTAFLNYMIKNGLKGEPK
jgi:hypothetical protein